MSDVWVPLLAAALVGYGLGSLNPALAAAKLQGKDLRSVGSGNPGATNAARAMGPVIGVVIALLDILKGFLPAWFFARYGPPCGEVAGVAAVLGHVTSPLLRGKGGKGVATSLGAILAVQPLWTVPVLIVFAATVALTKQMGVGSVVATVALIPVSLASPHGWEGVFFATSLAAIVVYRHIPNLIRFRDQLKGRSEEPEEGVSGTADRPPE